MVHCIGRGFHDSHVLAVCHAAFLSYIGSVYKKFASDLLKDIPPVFGRINMSDSLLLDTGYY